MATKRSSVASSRARLRVPEVHRNIATWPGVDESRLPEDERHAYALRVAAIRAYMDGKPVAEAASLGKMSIGNLYKLLQRCLTLHNDGRIWGLRILVKNTRMKRPARRAALSRKTGQDPRAGYGGIFGYTLHKHPSVEAGLIEWLTQRGKASLRPNRATLHLAHREYLALCAAAQIPETAYPFCTVERGRRALATWICEVYIPKYALRWVQTELGSDAARAAAFNSGDGSGHSKPEPWFDVQIDEHKIDVHARYEVPTDDGDWDQLDLPRFVLLIAKSISSGAILAFSVVLAREASAQDVARLVWLAMSGPPKVPQVIPGLDYMASAGYPANVVPELRWALLREVHLDNALAHLADEVQHLLQFAIGATVSLGLPRTPKERAHIESEFAGVVKRIEHQLPASVGSGPLDPLRKKGKTVPVAKRVRVDELEHVLDVYFADRNATSNAASNYTSPLERLRRQLQAGIIDLIYLPSEKRRPHYFSKPVRAKVMLILKRGARPYVNFMYAQYSSTEMMALIGKVGQEMWIRYDADNLRTIVLFDKDGVEFATLRAMGRWGMVPSNLFIRKLFGRLKRTGLLGQRADDDPITALYAHLRTEAPRDSNSALRLTRLTKYFEGRLEELEGQPAAEVENWRDLEKSTDGIDALPQIDSPPPPNAVRRDQDAANETARDTSSNPTADIASSAWGQQMVPRRSVRN